jgi:hypothetical protein
MNKEKIIFKLCNNCNFFINEINFYKGRNNCKKCEYQRRKCEHGKQKYQCIDCGGSNICKHGKRKSICIDCGGSSFCKHGKIKYQCIDCGGSQICKHGKQKSICIDCGGTQICEHGKQKSLCVDCGGTQICEHGKIKQHCIDCGGSQICEHGKHKYQCIDCNPNCACITCKSIYIDKRRQFYPHCEACFSNLYPDHPKVRNYKRKEHYFQDEIQTRFQNDKDNYKMIFNKIVDDGCSKRRPDVLLDLFLFVLIVECDENQHKRDSYIPECENKRMMCLFEDLGNRPIVFIRFNPDGYTDDKEKYKGCFKDIIGENRKKYYEIDYEEWGKRINSVEEKIREYIEMFKQGEYPEKEITIEKLYYDN